MVIVGISSFAYNSSRKSKSWIRLALLVTVVHLVLLVFIAQTSSNKTLLVLGNYYEWFNIGDNSSQSFGSFGTENMQTPSRTSYNSSTRSVSSRTECYNRVLYNSSEMVCTLRTAALKILDRQTSPFNKLGLSRYLPNGSAFLEMKTYKWCAVIGSSYFLLGSKLGKEIDSHDAVLRFNDALVTGFERDVGSKTTIRLINSQMLVKKKKNASLLKALNVNSTLFVWKAGGRDENLMKWYTVSKDMFNNYIKWCIHRPEQCPYVINPSVLWKCWDIIQRYTKERMKNIVPTTGFTGIHLMHHICESIDVYGYVTPTNTNCHYYDVHKCPRLAWHPVEAEKNFLKTLHVGNENDLSVKGKLSLYGFHHDCVTC
ncbi:beta-galactoside alpha-2,6-sialyltransferase 2-like [Saccoglossus kowalevskii]|uniref:beta-galactoside alpha-(2,6)-sialyltransferase n=1 Tax=Saccoglossus kowalevskii TaxID=10224 RepID=A0ABM0MFZ8_SACKO|nr:PREDICTED: beta-galactoside alpha-2,6-sialyltransferase 2-like [Saccoglossus kowalevskii]